MTAFSAGVDVGSTYTKVVLVDAAGTVLARAMRPTGFRLAEVAREALDDVLGIAGFAREDVAYVVTTGFGRHQTDLADAAVTDLTAGARGAKAIFPGTRTILDVGGQTMKATRLDEAAKVRSFRLNDKCAAGTGAFLEKTARYMGYGTEEIGPLVAASRTTVPISGVCAVFAESEVINHLSQGAPPADIMRGAVTSLVGRSVQLMKRVRMEPEFTLIGGIIRFETMVEVIRETLGMEVNVPPPGEVQFISALGAGLLGQQRLRRRQESQAAAKVEA